MKRFYKVLCVSLLSLFVANIAQAQIKSSPASEADKAFNTFQYVDAINLYKKAYGKVKRNPVKKNEVFRFLPEETP